MPDYKLVLGFDFGMKRIGIAVGQMVTRTANPQQIISASHGIPDWDELDKILQEWQPDALIVGLPFNMDGTEQHLTHCARKFGNRMRERFKLPVYFVDERLTSVAAKERVQDKSQDIDHISAQVILEDWLSGQEN